MIKVGVIGYGVIGQRLADGAALQKDMELVGVCDVAPTLSIRAMKEAGMPYKLYSGKTDCSAFNEAGIPISGTFDELVQQCDILLDSAPAGIGAKNKETYEKYGKKAVFQGGESDSVADVFFHGLVNYEKGVGAQYLKLTSCNTTGFIRAVDCLDKACGVEKAAITIIRREADPGDYHRGLTNMLLMEKAPSHQCLDLMHIMPHIKATGILVHAPVTHGHIITLCVTPKKKISLSDAEAAFRANDRIRVVTLAEGFRGNASFFRYARDLGNRRADMYEIGLWQDSMVLSGDDVMFAINIPQESVTIPETMDAIRAATGMQKNGREGVSLTNKYLGMGKWKA
jgi:glyceraldehyde-3-phosphate dehydrogenase (NAD(P))